MSPEQAAGIQIDGRTDVFAIGAILYKLLTGSTPMAAPPEDCDSLAKIILAIQEFQPELASKRMRDLERDEWVRHCRKLGDVTPQAIQSQIRGDLDWVLHKALDPDKTRRYATAGDFADDLQRFLDHQPVTAVAPSRRYRLKKFYQRRRPRSFGWRGSDIHCSNSCHRRNSQLVPAET